MFAREFREHFGTTATQFRAGGRESLARFRKRLEGRGAESANPLDLSTTRTDIAFRVDVHEIPELHVAYVRRVGRYDEIGRVFGRLARWAGPRRTFTNPNTQVLAVYYDNPDVTPVDPLRADACIPVAEGTKTKRDVGAMDIPGGLFAVVHVEIDPAEYGGAWDRLIGEWMPENRFDPDTARLCYENYLNDPNRHPEGRHVVDICEPVRPK